MLSFLLIESGLPSVVMSFGAIDLDMSGVLLYSATSPTSSLDAARKRPDASHDVTENFFCATADDLLPCYNSIRHKANATIFR